MIATSTRLRFLRLLTVLALMLVLPFVANLQKASAEPMTHMGGEMHESCASACAQISSSNAPQQTILSGEEIRTPDPIHPLIDPYFVQFVRIYEMKALHPTQTFGANTTRPPDIVALTTNYRL